MSIRHTIKPRKSSNFYVLFYQTRVCCNTCVLKNNKSSCCSFPFALFFSRKWGDCLKQYFMLHPLYQQLTGHYGDAVYHQLLYFSQIYLLNWVEDFRVSALELEVSPEDRDSFCVTEDTIPPSALYYLLWCKREERIWLHFRGWIFRAGSEVKHISACKTEHTWQGSRERQ